MTSLDNGELSGVLDGDGLYTDTNGTETRTHNAANELTARDPDTGGSQPSLPLEYDAAGNITKSKRFSTTDAQYKHDAWNRLVEVKLQQIFGGGTIVLQEHQYNGLHWRTSRRLDTSKTPNGLDQRRLMYYSAGWQLLEEHIDDSYNPSLPQTDRIAQQFWGIRYIDDAVLRRTDTGADGTYENAWHQLSDVQFSVVAVLDSTAKLSVCGSGTCGCRAGSPRRPWPTPPGSTAPTSA